MNSQAAAPAPGIVRTVLGDRPAAGFARVLMHEHLLWDLVPPDRRAAADDRPIDVAERWQIDYRSNEEPANARQRDPAVAAGELRRLAGDGGDLVVDQSTLGLARDAAGLALASREAGVAVVAAAGTYAAPYLDAATLAAGVDDLADRFVAEIETGLDGTGIRAGLIGEIGCSVPLHPFERRALAAAATAQRRTGAAISVHPGRDRRAPFEIVDLLGDAGADLGRVVLCHMDRTYPAEDDPAPAELASLGACVEWDFFGIEQSHYWFGDVELPTDRGRLRRIRALAERGLAGHVLVSQDICTKTRLTRWGGHGYGHLFRNVVPLMGAMGLDDDTIDRLVRRNPLRLLTLAPPGK